MNIVHLHWRPRNEWHITSFFGLEWTTMSYNVPPPSGIVAIGSNHAWLDRGGVHATGLRSSMAMQTWMASRTPVRTRSTSCMVVWTRVASRKGLWAGSMLSQPSPPIRQGTQRPPTESPSWNRTSMTQAATPVEPHPIDVSHRRGPGAHGCTCSPCWRPQQWSTDLQRGWHRHYGSAMLPLSAPQREHRRATTPTTTEVHQHHEEDDNGNLTIA